MAPFELLVICAFAVSCVAVPTGEPSIHRSSATLQVSNTHTYPAYHQPEGRQYKCFSDGDEVNARVLDWLTFDELWTLNRPNVLSHNNGDTYITHYIEQAFVELSREWNTDAALMFAIMMQKTGGRASAPCKDSPYGAKHTCGIMQVPGGSTFDPERPSHSIRQMVKEGASDDSLLEDFDTDARYFLDVTNRALGWDGRGAGYASCLTQTGL